MDWWPALAPDHADPLRVRASHVRDGSACARGCRLCRPADGPADASRMDSGELGRDVPRDELHARGARSQGSYARRVPPARHVQLGLLCPDGRRSVDDSVCQGRPDLAAAAPLPLHLRALARLLPLGLQAFGHAHHARRRELLHPAWRLRRSGAPPARQACSPQLRPSRAAALRLTRFHASRR